MTDKDNITLPREVVEQLLKMLEMVEPYADQLTDYSSTAAEWPLNLLPKKVSEAITALRNYLAAEQQEPVAKACWACNGKGCLRDIDTAGLLPCVVCKPQEDKT